MLLVRSISRVKCPFWPEWQPSNADNFTKNDHRLNIFSNLSSGQQYLFNDSSKIRQKKLVKKWKFTEEKNPPRAQIFRYFWNESRKSKLFHRIRYVSSEQFVLLLIQNRLLLLLDLVFFKQISNFWLFKFSHLIHPICLFRHPNQKCGWCVLRTGARIDSLGGRSHGWIDLVQTREPKRHRKRIFKGILWCTWCGGRVFTIKVWNFFVPTFVTKVTEYLCSGWVFFPSDKFRHFN